MSNVENLPQFIEIISNIINNMDNDKLKSFILVLAKEVSEDERIVFKNKLLSTENNNIDVKSDFINEVNSFIQEFKNKKKKGFLIDSEYNDEFRYWYDDYEDEYIFSDYEDSIALIQKAINFIHKAIDYNCYEIGYMVVELLYDVVVTDIGDYQADLEIKDLYLYNILNDYDEYFNDCMFLIYCNNKLDTLYNFYIANNFSNNVDNILKYNADLTEFNIFLNDWINYIGEKRNDYFNHNLYYSISLLNDEKKKIDYIYKYGLFYNNLFIQVLEDNLNSKNENIFKLGLYAINNLDGEYKEKALILSASYAKLLKKFENMNELYYDLFCFKPNMVNYLRLRNVTSNYKKEIIEICINNLDKNDLFKNILFLEGRYDYLTKSKIVEGLDDHNLLLPLATLICNDSKYLDKLLDKLVKYYYSEYSYKTICEDELRILFKNVTISCHNNTFTGNEFNSIANYIKNSIECILMTTIKYNKYKNYDTCSLYISSYGEVQEAIGVYNYKLDYINEIKNKYPTRRALHESLDKYI